MLILIVLGTLSVLLIVIHLRITHPYFLHPSDQPGISIVMHPLNGSNYESWSSATLMAFDVKNKSGFVDGTIVQPSPDSSLYSSWKRANSLVTIWLRNSICDEIRQSILYITVACDL